MNKILKYKNLLLRILCVFVILGWTSIGKAQAPNGLNFQTIVRDNAGKPLNGKNVNIRFSILKGSANGLLIYSEEHRTITNEFGLANVLIGYGFPLSGRFDQVDWSNGSFFLKTEIDPNGGINYELSGVSPFLSVPYALYAEKTKLEAGPGIQISGNRITNIGDPDPNDDLKNGSSVSGDLNGTLPAPKVVALQGRSIQDINPLINQALIWNGFGWIPAQVDNDPANDVTINSAFSGDLSGTFPSLKVAGLQGRLVQDVQPMTNQALVWNGSQWVPANVDVDATNDLLINSAAAGDLSGSYPAPKVVKLNGYPMSTTTPDSGDVLVFSLGEWKHLPLSTVPGGGSSVWKKSGNEVVLEDPVNVQKVNAFNASYLTQNQLITAKGSDSTYVSPIGINMSRMIGTTKSKTILNPGVFSMNSGASYLVGINSFELGSPYAEMEFWNYDPMDKSIRSFLNPYEIHFDMASPDRGSHLFANEFEIYRKTKDAPLEYSGVDVNDSTLVYYNGSKSIVSLYNAATWGGGIHLFDKFGKERINMTSLVSDQTQPYFSLSSAKTNREVIELLSTSSTGEMYIGNSNTNQLNVYAGYSSVGPNYPFLGIGDGAGGESAGMYLNTFGQGVVFGDVKSFRMDDPLESGQEIWYACVEGPEAGAYERGSGELINGEAFVSYSDHFKKVVNTQSVTVQLTPAFSDTYGIAVVEKNANGFRVKELKGGKGNFNFDWEVKAVRKGYENYEVYHKKETLRAKHDSKGIKIEETRDFIPQAKRPK